MNQTSPRAEIPPAVQAITVVSSLGGLTARAKPKTIDTTQDHPRAFADFRSERWPE